MMQKSGLTFELKKTFTDDHALTRANGEEAQFEQDYAQLLKADEYCVHYLVEHLHDAGQHQRMLQLLVGNKAWMEAKYNQIKLNSEISGPRKTFSHDRSDSFTRNSTAQLLY